MTDTAPTGLVAASQQLDKEGHFAIASFLLREVANGSTVATVLPQLQRAVELLQPPSINDPVDESGQSAGFGMSGYLNKEDMPK